MPFTVSHAAAVLPLSRSLNRYHLLSAAVIGSMAPDFGLFLPWATERIDTHSQIALFTFCLPLGLLAYWLFQYLIKQPLIELLPDRVYWRWQDHGQPVPITRLRSWLGAAFAILLGAISHLAWDGFTHENARGVHMFPSLDEPNVIVAGHRLYGYVALQLASSVVGLCIVMAFVLYTLRPDPEAGRHPSRQLTPDLRRFWLQAAAVISIGMFLSLFGITRIEDLGRMDITAMLRDAAIAGMRGFALAVLVTAFLLRRHLQQNTRSA